MMEKFDALVAPDWQGAERVGFKTEDRQKFRVYSSLKVAQQAGETATYVTPSIASFLALEARLAEAEALLREIAGHYAGGWRNDHLPLLESIAKADRFLEGKEKA